jgi:hypothetical protein
LEVGAYENKTVPSDCQLPAIFHNLFSHQPWYPNPMCVDGPPKPIVGTNAGFDHGQDVFEPAFLYAQCFPFKNIA